MNSRGLEGETKEKTNIAFVSLQDVDQTPSHDIRNTDQRVPAARCHHLAVRGPRTVVHGVCCVLHDAVVRLEAHRREHVQGLLRGLLFPLVSAKDVAVKGITVVT